MKGQRPDSAGSGRPTTGLRVAGQGTAARRGVAASGARCVGGRRGRRHPSSGAAGVDRTFALAFQRAPTASERQAAVSLVNEQGLFALCRALLNANEFAYLD